MNYEQIISLLQMPGEGVGGGGGMCRLRLEIWTKNETHFFVFEILKSLQTKDSEMYRPL